MMRKVRDAVAVRMLSAIVLKVLPLCICGLVACPLGAQTNGLSVARAALRDGLWEIARMHASGDGSPAAKLIVLESFAGDGKWDKVSETLASWQDETGPGFDYYRAVVRGDHAAAMEILRRGGSGEGCVEAKLFEAEELSKAGDRDGAERLWREVAATTNVAARALAIAGSNLADEALLRRAVSLADLSAVRRMIGLRLGVLLLARAETAEEGERMIRAIVKDSPDAEGAREAFLAVADAEVSRERWDEAFATYHEAIEIWPDVARMACVQEGRGWALRQLGRKEEALELFKRTGELAETDEAKAHALVLEGDILQDLGQDEQAMAVYRRVLEQYPASAVARQLGDVVGIRERETEGRLRYRNFKFAEAMEIFAEVAQADPARVPRMDFYQMLCLYGQGRDDEACRLARRLASSCPDENVARDARLWLAKFLYNRRSWAEAIGLFLATAEGQKDQRLAAEALLWAARAAFADGDFNRAILLATRLLETYAESPVKAQALLVQGEALIELARFDEAVLVFDRIAVAESASAEDRVRAQVLRADALYAMGADNPSRYAAALDAYRAVQFGGALSASERLVVAFKVARSLEKLKRMDEACDQYYAQVVLAYREGRGANVWFNEGARAAFSRAAFRLADEYEDRGRDAQAVKVLELVLRSDVPAAAEAAARIDRITNKGGVL